MACCPRTPAPVRVTPEVLAQLEALAPLAPLHQPNNLSPIRLAFEALPAVPQVACFDTAFHRSNPEVAQMFALPFEMFTAGIRRYGFHGLSYEYIASRLPEVAPALAGGKVVVLHLGNGASLCAIEAGRSVASTMGFTALDGLPMGTRCGAIDPGVLLYLMDERGMDARAIEQLLYRESGLLGVSGISSDLRVLLSSDSERGALAIDLFVYRIVREVGALAAVMGGLDGIVFTAGIGEHAAEIRRRVVDALAWMGTTLDEAANRVDRPCISTSGARCSAWVIPTDEERHDRPAHPAIAGDSPSDARRIERGKPSPTVHWREARGPPADAFDEDRVQCAHPKRRTGRMIGRSERKFQGTRTPAPRIRHRARGIIHPRADARKPSPPPAMVAGFSYGAAPSCFGAPQQSWYTRENP